MTTPCLGATSAFLRSFVVALHDSRTIRTLSDRQGVSHRDFAEKSPGVVF